MEGSGVTEDSRIPQIMQKMFDSRDLDLKVEVINAGVSGANTISEYKLISEKIVNYEPDLIMMYDGWNDLSADYPVDETIFNMEDICLDAFIRNFDVVFTLQPIAGFGNKILTEQEKINSLTGENHNGFQLIQGKSTYEWLAREMQSLSNDAKRELGQGVCESYDLRGSFDDVNGAVYWDQGHVLHAGNLIIAEKFFEISMKKIEPGFASDGKFRKIISDYNSIPIATYLFEKLGISDETFQTKFRDIKTIPGEQGNFFGLKAKFNGNVEEIFVGKDLKNDNLDLTKVYQINNIQILKYIETEYDYIDDKLNGYGSWYSKENKTYYLGYLKDGSWDGFHVIISPDEMKWGEFENGNFVEFGFVGESENEKKLKEHLNKFDINLNVKKANSKDVIKIPSFN